MKQKEGDQRFKGLGSDANAVEHQDKPLIASSQLVYQPIAVLFVSHDFWIIV